MSLVKGRRDGMFEVQRYLVRCSLMAVAACSSNYAQPFPSAQDRDESVTILRGTTNENGDLSYCLPEDPSDCRILPPEPECVSLETVITSSTGTTCETCYDADNRVLYVDCADPRITCTVVTAPEPDCLICAHSEGVVVYSSCAAQEPNSNDCYDDVSVQGTSCQRCYDAAGRTTIDECRDNCDFVACGPLVCDEGFVPYTAPQECCPICIPDNSPSCAAEICPQIYGAIECPSGWALERDSVDCCYYNCAPEQCAALATVTETVDCGAGRYWDARPPQCGVCAKLSPQPLECKKDTDCDGGFVCTTSYGDCQYDCPLDPSGAIACAPVCMGHCVPENPACTESPVVSGYCEGMWFGDGVSIETGCPNPPLCVCADGNIALNGVCTQNIPTCEAVACFAPAPTCDPITEVLSYDYPYCCGQCVPTDSCLRTGPENNATVLGCPVSVCSAGYHTEIGLDCCSVCVLDVRVCDSTGGCLFDSVCGPDGVCIENINVCRESDDGMDPNIQGKTYIQKGDNLEVLTDTCLDSSTLTEYYCTEAYPGAAIRRPATVEVLCVSGCSAGACL